jgi:hypothetical protein
VAEKRDGSAQRAGLLTLRKSISRLRSCSRRRPHRSGYLGGDLGRGGCTTVAVSSLIGLTHMY